MMIRPSSLFVLALAAVSTTGVPLNKRIAQVISDSTQKWEAACLAAGGGLQCNPISVAAFTTLLAAAGPCEQQDSGDKMIDFAHQLNNDADMIKFTQIFVQQPRNTPSSQAVPYCQKAPKNAELIGLYQCQFQGADLNTFVGGIKVGQPGTIPFGMSSPLSPPGSCPANPSGPIAAGSQLVAITQDPGLQNAIGNPGSGKSANSPPSDPTTTPTDASSTMACTMPTTTPNADSADPTITTSDSTDPTTTSKAGSADSNNADPTSTTPAATPTGTPVSPPACAALQTRKRSMSLYMSIKKRIAQPDLPAVAQSWQDLCLVSGGDIVTNDPCVTLAGINGINALLAGADPCAQQDNADAMIDFAKSSGIKNRDALIANAKAYRAHPRNALALDGGLIPSTPYCERPPRNEELNGIVNGQLHGVNPGLFGGPKFPVIAFGADGTCPFGQTPDVSTCTCH